MASSVGTANAGVPANATRPRTRPPFTCMVPTQLDGCRFKARRRRFAPRSREITLLPALTLRLRKIVDEALAFEVVHLVLDTLREQTLRLEFERLAVPIERFHLDALSTLDEVVQAGDGEAPCL